MTRKIRAALFLLPLLAVTACSQESRTAGMEADAMQQAGAADTMLAYERRLRVELPAGQVTGRLKAAREACETARFGLCHLLSIQQEQGNRGYLSVRLLPAGVEPLIVLARGE
ncbi:MAG: hypothetical protein LBF93_05700, partial [Zoogloeaceae bacterium]|nr:hypothetical protein [Zoogloeaceae bacterium]